MEMIIIGIDQIFEESRGFMNENPRNHEARDPSMAYNSLKINRELVSGKKIK
jgi:hypothetical protein